MSRNQLDSLYMMILDMDICSAETLDTIVKINGYTEKTLNDIIYVRTGYRSLEQMMEEM